MWLTFTNNSSLRHILSSICIKKITNFVTNSFLDIINMRKWLSKRNNAFWTFQFSFSIFYIELLWIKNLFYTLYAKYIIFWRNNVRFGAFKITLTWSQFFILTYNLQLIFFSLFLRPQRVYSKNIRKRKLF